MSHKYSHVRNMDHLNDELLKLSLKKQIIRHEIGENFRDMGQSIRSGKALLDFSVDWLKRMRGVYGSGSNNHDTMDKVVTTTHLLSGILKAINDIRK